MASYRFASRPSQGEAIAFEQGALKVPDNPIIPFVEGDGTGPDIWRASVRVFDAAVEKAYGGERKVAWMEVFAGEKAFTKLQATGCPQETVDAMQRVPRLDQGTAHDAGRRRHPLAERHAAPGARPLRLHPPGALLRGRRQPDEGAGEAQHRRSSARTPKTSTRASSGRPARPKRTKLREFIKNEFGKDIRENSAIGIKPMSAFGSKRLVEMAIRYALKHNLPSVTLMHKGNIMKFTEGAFRDWGYEVARDKFAARRSCRRRTSRRAAPSARADARHHQGPHRRLDVPAAAAAPR